MGNIGGKPLFLSGCCQSPCFFKFILNLCNTYPAQVHIINHPHSFSLFRVYNECVFIYTIITKDIPVPVKDAIVHRGLLSGFYSNRSLATFILSQCCHNRKTKFPVVIHRPNVIFDEIDFDTHFFELSCNDERIYRISCKTAHFTGNY